MWEAILFPTAALLYTIAIGKERIQKKLKPLTVGVFAVALAIDASATIFVCLLKAKSFIPTFHGTMGWLALLIMATHFYWAYNAMKCGGLAFARFHRWSPVAWLIWVVSFVSGIPR
jgi:uncharacterized repeat protein (TIGR03987 family)